MACDLLTKWLVHYDPIHRGWTPAGIANGVCMTTGFFFPRIKGGYNLRRGAGGSPDAAAMIAGAAGSAANTVKTFPWVIHDANTIYVYRLTAINGGGVENWSDDQLSTVCFDESGNWAGARPNAPADLRVTPTAGGRFVLRWTYTQEGQQAEPAEFRVYHDSGSGNIDFNTVVATVTYRLGRFHYSYTSEAFENGTRVQWVVRAVSAAGVEEDNEWLACGWADALAPPINPTVFITCG